MRQPRPKLLMPLRDFVRAGLAQDLLSGSMALRIDTAGSGEDGQRMKKD